MVQKKELFTKAFYSFVVGDCLGAPLEFYKDGFLPYTTEMIDNNYLDQAKGTWTDDTSMTLGMMSGLSLGDNLNYDSVMSELIKYLDGAYTVNNEVFDIGIGTERALAYYKRIRENPTKCGSVAEYNNGNGAMMRMLPIPFIKEYDTDINTRFQIAKNFTTLTHGHEISIVGSFLYTELIRLLIENDYDTFKHVLQDLQTIVEPYLLGLGSDYYEIAYNQYKDIFEPDFEKNDLVRGSGFVVDTFRLATRTLLTKSNLQDCMVYTANYGGDNDTVCAITSSIASLYFKGDSSLLKPSWLPEVKRQDILNTYLQAFLKTI